MNDTFQLNFSDLTEIMPFGLCIDGVGNIIHVGDSISKLCGFTLQDNVNIFSEFTLKSQGDLLVATKLSGHEGNKVTLSCRRNEDIQLCGSIVEDSRFPHYVLDLTPTLNTLIQFDQISSRASSFAHSDIGSEIFHLIEMQRALLEKPKVSIMI